MNDLIRVNRDDTGNQTVNARDLHEFLENGDKFPTWIKNRIIQYGFTQGIDFTTLSVNTEKGFKPRTEYHISIDMAKELSMVERNEKGKQARQYFIECERRAKDPVAALNDPATMRQLLLNYSEKCIEQEKTIKELQPKAFFADCVNASDDGCLVREMAKILAQKGIMNTGQNRLYQELRNRGYVIKQRGLDYNLPTQRSIDLGIMFISENIDIRSDGTTRLDRTTRITGKGQRYFVELFAKEMGKTPETIS